MPFVQHPNFPNDVREISAEQVKDYEDAGWKRVKKGEEPDPARVPAVEVIPTNTINS